MTLGDTEFFNVVMGQSPEGKSVSSDKTGVEFHQGKTSFTNYIIRHSGQYTSQLTKLAMPNSVLMSVRAPVGAINYTNRKICIGRGLCAIQTTDKVDSKFLYYIMQIYGHKLAEKSTGATFASTNADDIKAVKIPVPPLSEQARIVRILDRFHTLTSDLTSGLPAEIAARRKQYEYYREKLLTFDKRGA